MKKIYTIHEVRRMQEEVYEWLTTFHCHYLDNSVDAYDYDNMRKAWEMMREVISAKWTNQLL